MKDFIFNLQRFTETITLTEGGDKYMVTYGNSDIILYGLGGDDSLNVAAGVTSVTVDVVQVMIRFGVILEQAFQFLAVMVTTILLLEWAVARW